MYCTVHDDAQKDINNSKLIYVFSKNVFNNYVQEKTQNKALFF